MFSFHKKTYDAGAVRGKTATPLKKQNSSTSRIKKGSLLLFITAFIAFGLFGINHWTTTIHNPEEVTHAQETMESTTLPPGAKLSTKDTNLAGRDCTITHNSDADSTELYVWDYAAEDGDYVEVLVNGSPVSEPFMIRNKPKVFSVPTVGTIQVRGVRDGGGGITYAVYYPLNHTSYFNGVDIGKENTYTLIRQE